MIMAVATGAWPLADDTGATIALPRGSCATVPRSLDSVVTLAAGAEPPPADRYPVDFIQELPTGVPADTGTVNAITDVIVEATACARDNDLLRLLALYTDAYVVTLGADQPTLIENLEATPVSNQPVNSDLHVATIQDVLLLDDGRVSAIVTLGGVEDPHPAPGRTILMIFANENGRWLVDGQYERVWSGDSVMAPVYVADVIGTSATPEATPHP
jgi:hypothetical protein